MGNYPLFVFESGLNTPVIQPIKRSSYFYNSFKKQDRVHVPMGHASDEMSSDDKSN